MTNNTELKLEVGKAYRTRDGSRAVIHGDDYDIKGYPFIGRVDGYPSYTSWDVNGYQVHDRPDDRDLISEWQDTLEQPTETLRDKYAAAALTGLLAYAGASQDLSHIGRVYEHFAIVALGYADAMMERRGQK